MISIMDNNNHKKAWQPKGTLCSKLLYMQTLQHPISSSIHAPIRKTAKGISFFNWCKKQEEYHFAWVAFILAAQACILIPAALLSILVTGSNETALIIFLTVTAMSFVSLLSAMPTKYTIPAFMIALIVDVAVMVASWMHLFKSLE